MAKVKNRPVRYPWDKWFSHSGGFKLRLIHGIDFHCQPHGFAQQARNAARIRNKAVSIQVEENIVYLTVRRKPNAEGR